MLKPSTTRVTLLMGDVKEDARCTLYNAVGEVIDEVSIEASILHLDSRGAVKLVLNGVSAVFECIEQ